MVKPPLRRKSIGFKVSEEEYAQLETAARTSGRTLGEWCREVVLASASDAERRDPALADRPTRRGQFGRHLCGAAMSDDLGTPARLTWRRALPILALALAGFALTLRIFYPGVMTYDAWYVHADIATGQA